MLDGVEDMVVEREGTLKLFLFWENNCILDCVEGWNPGTKATGGDGKDGAELVRSMIVGL